MKVEKEIIKEKIFNILPGYGIPKLVTDIVKYLAELYNISKLDYNKMFEVKMSIIEVQGDTDLCRLCYQHHGKDIHCADANK